MVAGIIFDVDGTILDSMKIWNDAGKIYLHGLGIKAEENLGEKLFSMTMAEGADYLRNIYHLEMNREDIMEGINNTVFHFYKYDVLLKEGIFKFLDYMKAKGIAMTVATSTDRHVIDAAFTRLKINKYFKEIFTATQIGKGKDQPDIYLKAQECMKSDIENTWLIDDALYALRTAKKCGFKTIGIYDDASKKEQDKIKQETDLYIEDWNCWEHIKDMILG